MTLSTGLWTSATPQDLAPLMGFLLPQEWRSVSFTSRLLRRGRPVLPGRLEGALAVLHARGAQSDVQGAVLRTSGGLLLPVMPYTPEPEGDRLARLRELPRPERSLPRLLGERVYSIMGPTPETRWLESGLARPPAASIDYTLMTVGKAEFLQRRNAPAPPPRGLRIRTAAASDLGPVFPLQRAYELEEVVVFPERFSDQSCRANLRRTLRQQLVMVAELDGRLVAKAGTNARGFHVDQIGGVYTLEALRGQGIGTLVMTALLDRIFRTKRMASLFVKRSNQPALALYERLGFSSLDGYRISYFDR
jgi:ribosomal protein S18 acetylase RimI-like enzyme